MVIVHLCVAGLAILVIAGKLIGNRLTCHHMSLSIYISTHHRYLELAHHHDRSTTGVSLVP